jgi:hypothetical protein
VVVFNWQSSIITGTTLSAVAGNGYWIDTTSNACTVTLPASASVGDTIEFSDYARNWGTNACYSKYKQFKLSRKHIS